MDGYTILKNLIDEAKFMQTKEEQLSLLDRIFKHLGVVLINNDLIIFYNLLKHLIRNTTSFNLIDQSEIVSKFRESKIDYVGEFKRVLKKISLTTSSKIQMNLLKDILSLFREDIESKYQYINEEIFDEIRTILFRNLSVFNNLTEDEISYEIIQPSNFYLKKFTPKFNELEMIDTRFYPSIIKYFCRENRAAQILDNYEFFTSTLKINPLELAFYMLSENSSFVGFTIADRIETFDSQYHPDIADLLIYSKNSLWLVDEIERFKGVDLIYVLNKILDSNEESIEFIVMLINKLNDLKIDTALKIVKSGYLEVILHNLLSDKTSFNQEVKEYFKNNKDKNLTYKSFYVFEILKAPSLIADICS